MTGPTRHPGRARTARRFPPHFAVTEDMRMARRFPVPPSQATPKRMFLICHYCGFDPPHDLPASGVCPKCGCSSWERFTLAEALIPAYMK